MNKKILFTGGGSAGHVTVNLALIPKFQKDGWDTVYIGSATGIEKQLISTIHDVRYHEIATGKLRRYFDWNNFKDPFKVAAGVFQAYNVIRKEKPSVIFSKGGFVSVPVVLGAWLNRIPVVIHESDYTPGLANKISIPFASKVCTTFPETERFLKTDKAEYVGAIVREELFEGDAARGRKLCDFVSGKPVLLIMGGSLGSQRINQAIRNNLDALLASFQIVHICGKGQVDEALTRKGYKQFEYISDELPDVMAMADLVVSRAGSNSIYEFLALKKPMLLIPLSKGASRGDQILNANSFKRQGYAEVLMEENLTDETLLRGITSVHDNRATYLAAMEKGNTGESLSRVYGMLKRLAGRK
ncbi:undecaprenyldiphospho-muramoylpentapeptide beta-N-acetylglucosaminyltransferase [Brevibacillus dissolubilis]|uniref:undecaprenyldiphospho-muramoylpentapeptide beta-N-acetylglucosaminyltransferase n=1 Tax=Brevibacillus dissolubilis TaxID=1844116 RepID=UPI001116C351|nr:undecaprenyldiphospho-muramoylpentapeptide beta-N-acetylglucosaminyltransferase [Brevibacillus dissolubilis]